MYNIAKVAKGEVLRFFNSIFDALCKLAADPAPTVKNGADLLDRLIKDIVSELSTTYVSPHQEPLNPVEEGEHQQQQQQQQLVVPKSLPRNTAFSLPRFIPVLSQRIYVRNSFSRQYLVSWIAVLDSIPDLELVSFLPEFLDGLLNCLSDPSEDVRNATTVLLGEFLQEIKEAAAARMQQPEDDNKGTYLPGQGVIVQYERIVETLVQHLSSPEEELQRTALQWLNEFIQIAKDVVIKFTPRIILAVLPCLAHQVPVIRETANETNQSLQRLVLESSSSTAAVVPTPPQPSSSISDPAGGGGANDEEQQQQQQQQPLQPPALRRVYHSDVVARSQAATAGNNEDPFDYQATVSNLRLQFLNEHEETRVASLEWLLMLHKKAPTKILASDDGTFPALLKTLSDSSEEACISYFGSVFF